MVTTDNGIHSPSTPSSEEGLLFLNLAEFPQNFHQQITDFYRKKFTGTEENKKRTTIQEIALYKTLEYGFLGLFLYDISTERFVVTEGYLSGEVEPLLTNYFHRLNEHNTQETNPIFLKDQLLNFNTRWFLNGQKQYVLGILSEQVNYSAAITGQIVKMFSSFFFEDSGKWQKAHEYNYTAQLSKALTQWGRNINTSEEKLYFVLIEIEQLSKYIKVAGDYLVSEIIQSVKGEIEALIEHRGQCFILNPRQFLAVVSDFNEDTIKEKFMHAHFRVKNLLLLYQMKYYEISGDDIENNSDIINIWPNLKKINEK